MSSYLTIPTPRKDPDAPRLASTDAFGFTVLVVLALALGALAYVALWPRLEQAALPLTALPGGRVEYVQDHAGSLTLADLTTGAAAQRFQPIAEARNDRTLRRVPGARVNWLRLTIPNDEPHPLAVVLQFSAREIEDAEIFAAPAESSRPTVEPLARTGARREISERPIRSHLPAFAVTLAAQHTTVLYVRNAAITDSPGSVFFWRSLDDFRRHERRELLTLAAYLALGAVLLLFQALGAVVFHDRALLWFCGYLAAMIALVVFATHLTSWLWVGPAGLSRAATVLGLTGLAGLIRIQVARSLLDTKQRSGALDGLLRFWMWLLAASAAAGPALLALPEALPLANRVVGIVAVSGAAVLPLAAAYAAWRGSRIAPLAAIAFTCVAVGTAAVALAHFGLIAPDPTGGAPILIGSALELVLLGGVALFRQRVLRETNEHAQLTHVSRMERAAADAKGDVLSLSHQLAQSKQDKDRLLAMIAQEVRAPMASLLAVSRSLPPERAAEQLPIIRRRCTALIDLLNTLIDWGRLRTGHFAHDPAPFSLAPAVDAALRPIEAAALEKGIRLDRRIPHGVTVRGDAAAFACVLRNLVGNALKFTPTGGAVTVEAQAAAKQVELHVQDNGVGMTAEQVARLDPRTLPAQVPATPGTAGETGLGLGLAVTRELLERDSGSLRFESTLGRGTVAIATLPAETIAPPPAPALSAATRPVAAAVN